MAEDFDNGAYQLYLCLWKVRKTDALFGVRGNLGIFTNLLIYRSKVISHRSNKRKDTYTRKEYWKNENQYNQTQNSKQQNFGAEKTETVADEQNVDYSNAYQAKLLLSKNEWYEYKKLKKITDEKNLHICPKVRLLDIVEPRNGQKYMGALGKVKSKHVDFLITDQDLRIKGIIELDDNSHNKADRIERDYFVDTILKNCGYKIVHARTITEETIQEIIS